MVPRTTRFAFSALLAAAALPAALGAQAEAQAQRQRRCSVVADTVPGPTPAQVRERAELVADVAAVFAAHGAPAQGLLYVDVDSTRHGAVRFLDMALPDSTVQAATARVAEYLRTLPRGHAYRALVRIDGEYLAPSAGKRHCMAEWDNPQDALPWLGEQLMAHPLADRRPLGQVQPVLMLVVDREGAVAYAELATPTGDRYVDAALIPFAYRMRFLPASLDGVPMDTRFRLALPPYAVRERSSPD